MSSKGLFKERKVYKPLDYQWAYDAWYPRSKNHWPPEEVPMNDDIRDWKYNLTTSE